MSVLIVSILASGLLRANFPIVQGADGRLHDPLAEAHRKPLALLFISHDCPICNAYAPEIGRLEKRFGSKVQIDLVYCDLKFTGAEAKSHANEFGIGTAGLLLDPAGRLSTFCKATVTPQAVVFDHLGHRVYSGRIDDRYFALGRQRPAATSHDLALALDAVISGQTPHPAGGPPVGCFIVSPNLK